MWNPPGGQHRPDGVGTRRSRGRMRLKYVIGRRLGVPMPGLSQSSGDLIADRRYAIAQDFLARSDLPAAADLLAQAIEAAPQFCSAWFCLGETREKLGERSAAVAAFQQVRALDAEDRLGAGLHLVRLGALPAGDMPASYVRTLFDQYAARFDAALTDGLAYRGPALLRDTIAQVCSAAQRPMQFPDMLDLGCGTGLAGAAFRPSVHRLVGVDLSAGMVAVAAAKNIYDRIETGDLLQFLQAEARARRSYGLILASDGFASLAGVPRDHPLELLAKAGAGRWALLIAPTGAGKALAGFLPTLVDLTGARPNLSRGLHTLYISPLKALAVDVARNLERPVAEMGLGLRIETRTGDTPVSKRVRQRPHPPDILLTTPEQVALLLASADAPHLFGSLRRIVLDELHALVTSKRGDLLSLGLARLFRLAPRAVTVGLSATVAEPDELARYLVAQPEGGAARADLVIAEGGAPPIVRMLQSAERVPWAGHSARHALAEIYDLIGRHKTTPVFVNTRMQAEMIFQELWR